jgi:hypothetical protein
MTSPSRGAIADALLPLAQSASRNSPIPILSPDYRSTIMEANMSSLCKFALLGCLIALLAGFMFSSQVEARQGGFGGFFFAPFWSYEPPPWRQRYYAPPRKRYYAPSRKRKVVRAERRNFSQAANRRAALAIARPRKVQRIAARELPQKAVAVPNESMGALPPISCEKAQAIVAEFGFKQIKAELCIGENFEFHATRDGKPFLIEIEAANGELAKVQRLR